MKPVKRHIKYIFPIVQKELINDEPKSYHSGSLFFMTLTYFSGNRLRGVSLIPNAWKREQHNLIIAAQRTWERETSLPESEVGLWIEYEENAVKQ